jgi:alkylation response protein AidB-like acyl-CoA dehydrogenase
MAAERTAYESCPTLRIRRVTAIRLGQASTFGEELVDTTHTGLTPELAEITEGLRAFVQREVVERQKDAGDALSDPRQIYGPDGRFAAETLRCIRQVRTAAAASGYYTMFVPEELGGAGLGHVALYVVWENLYHQFGPGYWLLPYCVAHWSRGPSHVLMHATDAIRDKVLPQLMSGDHSICFGMSEPDAGSDARMMRTRATPDGDGWRISGRKIWITNGPYADYAVIFAVTDQALAADRSGGISAFLVPTDSEGFSSEGSILMFNGIGGDEAELYLDDVYVEGDHLLGELGAGFEIALSGVSSGRVYNSARAVGVARWALERALAYVQERSAFGRPISSNQGVTFPLADSATEIHAAHLLGLHAADQLDQGSTAVRELSMSKLFSTEAAVRAVDRSMQVHGAMGFTNELGMVEAWQMVRKTCVADGTSEILRRTIAAQLLKGNVSL